MIKTMLLVSSVILLSGCSALGTKDYAVYVEAQKSLSRDNTVNETAKVNALIEMTKSADPAVRATGIMLLQQLQQGSKKIDIEPPKKNMLGM